MRLTKYQTDTIKELAHKYFGTQATVSLFGSRTDDQKRGGDIDLIIKSDDETMLTLEKKIHFLAELKTKIGDRHIDTVFDNNNTRMKKSFYHSIMKDRIEL